MDSDVNRLLTGQSESIRMLRSRICRIAAFDSNVLLVGETGTGKERAAQALHCQSSRRSYPLISVNCAAIPEPLIESELFGFERGAFTGASVSRPGRFSLAEGGTLFLDEIGELPFQAQAKILRAIENREYYRLGGTRPIHTNVRLVVATHRDLGAMCARGEFRPDLYYRLNVARVEIPPLRERSDDIRLLSDIFLAECCNLTHRPRLQIAPGVYRALQSYEWPGNVRELRNTIEFAIINAETDTIELADLPSNVLLRLNSPSSVLDERSRLVELLEKMWWNKSATARALRWSRMKLYRKLRLYRLLEAAGDSGTAIE